ncbi:unnamed protein product [Nezara viridula]|nr:unnamed protein product [Nezara viridula]
MFCPLVFWCPHHSPLTFDVLQWSNYRENANKNSFQGKWNRQHNFIDRRVNCE